MKFLNLLLFLLWTTSSLASLSPCDLLEQKEYFRVTGANVSKIIELGEKLKKECQISQRFSRIRDQLTHYDVDINHVSIYKALQFIHIWAYEMVGKKQGIDFPFIYQKVRNPPKDYIRTRLVWDNWSYGHQKLENYSGKLKQGHKINLQDVLQSHKDFYFLSQDVGETEHEPRPGELKSYGTYNDYPWWSVVQKEEQARIKRVFNRINGQMRRWELLPETQLKDLQGNKLDWLITIENGNVYISDPKLARKHLEIWVDFFNTYSSYIRNGYVEEIKVEYPVLSPLEFATFIQKWFVTIHPFYDGNGRTSRLWQDVVLSSYQLPLLPSGLLSEDVDISFQDYYQKALSELEKTLLTLERCVDEYKKGQAISYDCKVVF